MQRALTLVAATAALSGLGVNGSPHRPTDLRRRAMPEIPGYDFAGCYTEANGARALTGSNYFDDQMTIQKCAAACSGFKYFGVEYGRECYCGNTLNTGSIETQISECSFSCPGEPTQNCGAGNSLSMYVRSAEVTPPTTPTTYSYRGCYAEPAEGRALTGQMTGTDDMTVAKCATFCGNAGYSHFGLEYYHECYCGNNLAPGAQSAPEADCNFPCAGDASEECGGDWRINLYQFGSATASSSSSSRSASSTPTPSAGVSAYTSEGCYTEATGKRALSDVSFYDDALTVEKCAAVCSTYTWFGLEYGRECYCGNTPNAGSVPTALSECSFNCPGNSAQKCGAGNRLNMYRYLPATPSASSVVSTTTSSSSSSSVESATSSSSSSLVVSATPLSSSSSTVVSTTSSSPSSSVISTATSSSLSSSVEPTTLTSPSSSIESTTSSSSSTAVESTTSTSSSSSVEPTSSTSLSSTVESTTSTSSSSTVESTTSTSPSSTVESTTSSSSSTVESTASTSSSSTVEPTTSSSSSSSAAPTTSTSSSSTVASSTATSSSSTTTTTLITATSSSSSTSSSSTSSSSTSSTSTIAPLPTEAITNGGFENPGGWTIKTSAPGILTYTFSNTNDPHGGLQSASVAYSAGASAYQAWFSYPITLRPNKRYLFSGWSKASSANPGCSISYYIGTSNGNQNLKTLATITSANLRPAWIQSSGFYDATTITDLSFNVRWTCTGAAARTYYIDDLSLTTTP